MENNYNKLINNLKKLNLNTLKNYLDVYIEKNNHNEINLVDSLYELTNLELKFKRKGQIALLLQ